MGKNMGTRLESLLFFPEPSRMFGTLGLQGSKTEKKRLYGFIASLQACVSQKL